MQNYLFGVCIKQLPQDHHTAVFGETLLSLEEGMVEEADNQMRLCYKVFLCSKVFQLLMLVALMGAKATEADPGIFSREGNANTFKGKRWHLVATNSQAPSAKNKGVCPCLCKDNGRVPKALSP